MSFFFKKEYKPLIVSGKKTQTVRIWKRCWLHEGQVVQSPGLGKLRIEEIVKIKLSDLTQEDARLDGFASKAQMLDALKKIYNLKQTDGTACYRIRFKYLGEAETATRAKESSRVHSPKQARPKAGGSSGRSTRNRLPKAPAGSRKGKKLKKSTKLGSQERLFPPF